MGTEEAFSSPNGPAAGVAGLESRRDVVGAGLLCQEELEAEVLTLELGAEALELELYFLTYAARISWAVSTGAAASGRSQRARRVLHVSRALN